MNKQTFLKCLERKLKSIPREDREDALNYYREYFEEMGADEEQDVTVELGTPDSIAKNIIAECTKKHVEKQRREGGIKNGATTFWLVLLGICGAPVALPMLLVGVLLVLVLVLVLFILVLCVYIMGAAGVVGGVAMLSAVFMAGEFAQAVVCFGLALLLAGVGILIFLGAISFGKFSVRGVSALFHKLITGRRIS